MQRSEQICNAAKIGIGYLHACEDAAKKRVLQLFRKSNDINYKKMDNETRQNKDDRYMELKKRYNYLVNKVFGAISLSNNEMYELDYLTGLLGDFVTPTQIIKKINKSIVVTNILHGIKKVTKIKHIKTAINSHKTALKKFYDTSIKYTFKLAYFGRYATLNSIMPSIKSSYFLLFGVILSDLSPLKVAVFA